MLYIPCRDGLHGEYLCEELIFLPRMSRLIDLLWPEKRVGVQVDLAALSPSPQHLPEGFKCIRSLCPGQEWPELNLCCGVHSYSIEIRGYWAMKEPVTDLCGLNTDHEHTPSPQREQPIEGLAPCLPKRHSCLCLAEGVWQKRAALLSEGKRRLQHVLASFVKQIYTALTSRKNTWDWNGWGGAKFCCILPCQVTSAREVGTLLHFLSLDKATQEQRCELSTCDCC